MGNKNICIITTMSSSIDNWIKPFLPEYRKLDINVTVVCNMTDEYMHQLESNYPGVRAHPIDFPRGANMKKSLSSIVKLKRLFKSQKFDMVQYATPNASVYSSIASWICKVPVRLYCQWGMIYVTKYGAKRLFYKNLEKLACKLSTNVQPDSFGNLEFCRKEKLYDESKSEVIWNGSAKGIDLSLYDVSKKSYYAKEIKERYGIPDCAVVIGFVGRLGAEKGCNELLAAFREIEKKYSNVVLLFVGPLEKCDTIRPDLISYFFSNDRIIKTDRVSDVEKHMAALDLFVLPSYREGFGMSVVEAEAMGVPVIVTEYPGPVGGMIVNKTGLSIPLRNTEALINAIESLIDNHEMRESFGSAGITCARNSFDYQVFVQKYMENRIALLSDQKKLLGV